jgi:hypothetical protein
MDLQTLGGLTGFTIPYTNQTTKQDYLNYLDSGLFPNDITIQGQIPQTDFYYQSTTGYTGMTFLGFGASRIQEKRKYGGGLVENLPSGAYTNGDLAGISWTGYTFDVVGSNTSITLYYEDRSDGTTLITGSTANITQEAVINFMLTRNEHFLGFVEQPTVYSDVFVERGKQGVMEKNLRLGEIDNLGELNIYGNGFFKVKTQ